MPDAPSHEIKRITVKKSHSYKPAPLAGSKSLRAESDVAQVTPWKRPWASFVALLIWGWRKLRVIASQMNVTESESKK